MIDARLQCFTLLPFQSQLRSGEAGVLCGDWYYLDDRNDRIIGLHTSPIVSGTVPIGRQAQANDNKGNTIDLPLLMNVGVDVRIGIDR